MVLHREVMVLTASCFPRALYIRVHRMQKMPAAILCRSITKVGHAAITSIPIIIQDAGFQSA